MKKYHSIISVFLLVMMVISVFPVASHAAYDTYEELGNIDLNITNGGIMLTHGDDFYYSENGIYRERAGEKTLLSTDNGKNLNLADGYIYYTLGSQVLRISVYGGKPESVYTHNSVISKMYTVGSSELRFVSGGLAYSHNMETGKTQKSTELSGIFTLIPTKHGDIYITGSVFDYNVYANNALVLEHVSSFYTDSGYLVINKETANYQAELYSLFNGFDANTGLVPFNVHGTASLMGIFAPGEDEAHICSICEENAKLSNEILVTLMGNDHIVPDSNVSLMAISEGQKSIVKRARQLHEIEWTPLEDRSQWGYRGIFKAGTTYKGLPYGQPVNTGYVGWSIPFSKYMNAVNDNTSVFYTDYSTYNKIAPYYSTDCSAFVSYAWAMKSRHTTYSIPNSAEKVGDQSIYSLQVGDCLNHLTSHVVLVSDVWFDSTGAVTSVEIMEQTPVITKLTRYGASGTKTLANLQSTYLNSGYYIYRYPERGNVTYTHDCNVPIDGDYCGSCKTTVPKVNETAAVGSKTVSLSHKDSSAAIYYTLDGSAPSTSSTRYTEPVKVSSTTKMRAIAVTSKFSDSSILEYTIKVPPVAKPTVNVTSGVVSDSLIASGTKLALVTSTSGATLYYTTDGQEPTTSSNKYSEPLTITKDITIKVIGIANGMAKSETATFTYKIGKTHSINASAGKGGSISPTGNTLALETTSKTFTITPNAGFKIGSVTVNGTSVGAVSSYEFKNITGGHTISVTFIESVDIPFTDVKSDAWYIGAVNHVYKNGLFTGATTTLFDPEGNMTRAMFVTVLGRMSGQSSTLGSNVGIVTGSDVRIRKEPNTNCDVLGIAQKYRAVQVLGTSGDWYKIQLNSITGYIRNDYLKVYKNELSDLPSGQYYTPYVQWAYLCGIAGGTGSSSFSPDRNITREEMCVMMFNYAQKYNKTLKTINEKKTFNDDSNMTASAKTAIYEMQKAGVIVGNGDGNFYPKNSATRAEVAQIFKNFMEAIS